MTSKQRNWSVFFGAIAATGLASIAFLAAAGNTPENLHIALRLSARIAFVVLLIVFVARPLQQMLKTPFTARLLRNRRLLGIAFAGIHTAHLGLIVYRGELEPNFNYLVSDNLPGMLTYAVIFIMFATSFNASTRMLGPKNWRILHKIGLYWLFVAFTLTQLPASLNKLEGTNWFMLGMIFVALVVRLTAFIAKYVNTER